MGWISPSSIDSGEAEHRQQRRVHTPLFFGRQAVDEVSESPHIDCTRLFYEHSSGVGIDLDHGSKRCGSRPRRCWRKQNHRAREENVGLYDHAIPGTVLLMAHPFRESQSEDVTPLSGGSP